jgi:hypothetical protein
MLISSTFIALFLLIWFKSDAIVEWGSLLGLSKFLKLDAFYKMRIDDAPLNISYPTFLKIKYNNFIVNMIACPLCLATWIVTFMYFSFATLLLSPSIVILIPTVTLISLTMYGIVSLLLKL